MFSHIKISAILVGLFIHVTSGLLFFFTSAYSMRLMEYSQNQSLFAISFILILLVLRTLAFLATGYVTANIAKSQPLLHGFICGCASVGFNTFFGTSSFLSLFICLPAIVTGAWLYKKRREKNA